MQCCRHLTPILAIAAVGLAATLWWSVESVGQDRGGRPAEQRDGDASDKSNQKSEGEASESDAKAEDEDDWKPLTRAQLRRKLSRIQYYVTQEEGTEPAFRNAYWNNKQKGTYLCVVCEKALFTSATKFRSGTGWPSFWQPLDEDVVGTKTDYKMLFPRTEVHCKRCGAHLGHVFDDGPRPTGLRYCMNSAALKFVAEKDKEKGKDKDADESTRQRRRTSSAGGR